jgi:hypothetical protein
MWRQAATLSRYFHYTGHFLLPRIYDIIFNPSMKLGVKFQLLPCTKVLGNCNTPKFTHDPYSAPWATERNELKVRTANRVGRVGIATGYAVDGQEIESRWGVRFSTPVQTGAGAHPASCTMGTGSFPEVKSGRGVTLTSHPLLVPWSWKSRAIPLLPLWAVGLYRASVPVQGCTLNLPRNEAGIERLIHYVSTFNIISIFR